MASSQQSIPVSHRGVGGVDAAPSIVSGPCASLFGNDNDSVHEASVIETVAGPATQVPSTASAPAEELPEPEAPPQEASPSRRDREEMKTSTPPGLNPRSASTDLERRRQMRAALKPTGNAVRAASTRGRQSGTKGDPGLPVVAGPP